MHGEYSVGLREKSFEIPIRWLDAARNIFNFVFIEARQKSL
jgi:hypothetical protein